MGKLLIFIGITLILVGLIIEFGPRMSFFGRLPGDITIERENFRFYFPITTSLVIGIILSLILYIIKWLRS